MVQVQYTVQAQIHTIAVHYFDCKIVSCSTVDDICLSDLNKCMGIFVVCQLQLNSATLFLTRTVHCIYMYM